MKVIITALLLFMTLSCSNGAGQGTMPWDGKIDDKNEIPVEGSMPLWEEGCFDIHAINTGRGECTFLIFPDGTTMVIDAGEFVDYKNASYDNVIQKPNSSTRPFEVYAKYIQHFLPKGSSKLDYMMITHYHMDHFGRAESAFDKHPSGGYVLSGVTALYDRIPFDTIIDRSYPDYETEKLYTTDTGDMLGEYAKFIEFNSKNSGLKPVRCQPGNKIVLTHNPEKYPNFKALNWAASGSYWDGSKVVDANTEKTFRENAMSCAVLFSYGNFDYWTSGDGTTCDVAASAHIPQRVDAMKANHHMSKGTLDPVQLKRFRPEVIVTQSFYLRTVQPNQDIMRRIADRTDYDGDRHMFFTNIDQSIQDTDPLLYKKADAINGHIVIRVAPGGGSFTVYVLDDTDFEYRILSVHGPYSSK